MDDATTLRNATDLAAFWMPFTANRQFKGAPRMLVSASGMYYRADDGREVLDGTAGLWCVNAGHGRREIAEALQRQVLALDYAPSFQMGHPIAFDFAARLARIAPPGLDRIFYVNSGSEAVDTALKMAMAYHRARGEGQRTRLIGREKGYHGVGFGGISVGGLVNNRRAYVTLPSDHLRHTQDLAANAFARGLPKHGAERAEDLEQLVALHGADTIAAVIVEPVAGAGGVLPPPRGYLQRLREICDRHGILLIFDEVITGFGRLGTPFASQFFDVTPDLMTTAKGITNATVPMGAVFAGRHVHDAIMEASQAGIEFFHGYTYSGHPLACAAGMATMDIYEREGLLTRAAGLAPIWEEMVHRLADAPHVIDIRNVGLLAAVELQPRKGAPGARGYEALVKAFEAGLTVRAAGDIICLSPPLIVEEAQIGLMAEILREVICGLD
ncbi:MAG: aminotransferase class III-fold pyridoxal phosphate-dependent enzyme [Phenylobacterium sp.]|uniref:aspartate aminotransferase family protein n=1 Tax=Phenylobacterium sp. TaxID=1871053 RepID=UPI0025F6C56F|nr:aspartate aminotransferase family protein [Phenylobacterium sp.]MBI1197775.1 aminotransferase class III-fold pyridoxal phosphate-dependent enzyme [Phenylobacterium sp.]